MSNIIGIMKDSATGDSHFCVGDCTLPTPSHTTTWGRVCVLQNHAVCGNVRNLVITEEGINNILNRMTSYATNSVTRSTLVCFPNDF
jgi:hypothetical protein